MSDMNNMKGLTELEETNELWNLGDGLENVCNSVMRKLHYAGHVLEERNRTIINLDSYEVTAMIWALNDFMRSGRFAEWGWDRRNKVSDLISRQAAIDAIDRLDIPEDMCVFEVLSHIELEIGTLPSAQPEQRYTEEELKVFRHGISLSLLSKRSAQHWQYDEDRATEIKFLERLYEKVGADMRGEQDG